MDIYEAIRCCMTERTRTKTIPIEPSSDLGVNFQMFFLPHDEVKVWVHTGRPDSANHPTGPTSDSNGLRINSAW